jgi:hypothetical protein
MKSKRIFVAADVLEAAKSGALTGAALRKAVLVAEEFGNAKVADELRQYLVSRKRLVPA